MFRKDSAVIGRRCCDLKCTHSASAPCPSFLRKASAITICQLVLAIDLTNEVLQGLIIVKMR